MAKSKQSAERKQKLAFMIMQFHADCKFYPLPGQHSTAALAVKEMSQLPPGQYCIFDMYVIEEFEPGKKAAEKKTPAIKKDPADDLQDNDLQDDDQNDDDQNADDDQFADDDQD